MTDALSRDALAGAQQQDQLSGVVEDQPVALGIRDRNGGWRVQGGAVGAHIETQNSVPARGTVSFIAICGRTAEVQAPKLDERR